MRLSNRDQQSKPNHYSLSISQLTNLTNPFHLHKKLKNQWSITKIQNKLKNKNKNETYLGTRDSEEEAPEASLSAPSVVLLEQNTLVENPSGERDPDPKIPIGGWILLLKLGTEGVKNPDALAIQTHHPKPNK